MSEINFNETPLNSDHNEKAPLKSEEEYANEIKKARMESRKKKTTVKKEQDTERNLNTPATEEEFDSSLLNNVSKPIETKKQKISIPYGGDYVVESLSSPEDTNTIASNLYDKEENKDSLSTDRAEFYNKVVAYLDRTNTIRDDQFNLLKKYLEDSSTKLERGVKALADAVDTGPKMGAEPRILKGEDARLTFIAKLAGLRRIMLFNSGFHIVIRPMNLAEISSFFTTVDIEYKEYGRLLGGHFYLMVDYFLKQKISEILPSIVVSSNLVGWDKGTTLIDNISLHDYESIVWGILTLMYRKGINIDLICTNPECATVTKEYLCDLAKMRYHDYSKLHDSALSTVASNEPITPEQCALYRKQLSEHSGCFSIIDTNNVIKVDFKTATLGEYLTAGNVLMSNMATAINGKLDTNNVNVSTYITGNFYKMLAPWVSQISVLNDDGTTGLVTDDLNAIMDTIDLVQDKFIDFGAQFDKFVSATRVSFIVYYGMECPKCHHKASDAVNDFKPVDVQLLFFYLSYRELSAIGN